MKCPKCGYNSFETYDACKKCGNDLSSYKDIHGLKPIVLPVESRTAMAEKLMAGMVTEEKHEEGDAVNDMFSFDVSPEADAVAGSNFSSDDPFNFDEVPAAPAAAADPFGASEEQKSAQAKAEEEAFADLLESTSQSETPEKAAASDPDDLSNFSWDDSPEVTDDKPAKSGDDFDDLFGDSDDTTK